MSTEAENSLVMGLAGGTENTWLGGHDTATEGTYAWRWGQSLWPRLYLELLYHFSDGTAWSFTKWKNNAPNNGGGNSEQDCVSMGTTGEWDDVACSTERCGVLEQISSANVLCRQYVCRKGDLQQTATTAPTACTCGTGWTAK